MLTLLSLIRSFEFVHNADMEMNILSIVSSGYFEETTVEKTTFDNCIGNKTAKYTGRALLTCIFPPYYSNSGVRRRCYEDNSNNSLHYDPIITNSAHS